MVGGIIVLESIFGNSTVEKVLFFIETYGEGYAKGMAKVFGISLNGIQQQLKRLEDGGVVISKKLGKTRVYRFNPRYSFFKELKALILRAFEFLPQKDIDAYYSKRTRPRRKGKPL